MSIAQISLVEILREHVTLEVASMDAPALDACPERAGDEAAPPLVITRALLELVSPETCAVPDVRTPEDVRLLTRLWQLAPALSAPEGWAVRFGRELTPPTIGTSCVTPRPGCRCSKASTWSRSARMRIRATRFVRDADAARRLPAAPFARARVAYRDIASASNQRTLIAAVVPAGTVTTHTLFCCRSAPTHPYTRLLLDSEPRGRAEGTRYVAAMPTNLYGPNDNYDLETGHVLPALIRKAHEAKERGDVELVVWGTGRPMREFLHVDDMADACVFLMESGVREGLYNVGTGSEVSIRELAQTVMDIVGFTGRLVFDTSKPDGTPRKLLDVGRLCSLGWPASTPLREGIALVYRDFLAART